MKRLGVMSLSVAFFLLIMTSNAQAQFTGYTSAWGGFDGYAFMRDQMGYNMALYGRGGRGSSGGGAAANLTPQQRAWLAKGKQIIAAGRATTEVQMSDGAGVAQKFALYAKLQSAQKSQFIALTRKTANAYAIEIKKYGLKPNDMAATMSAFIDICRQINLGTDELTLAQFKSLYEQVRGEMIKNEALQGMSVSEKQVGCETIIVMMAVLADTTQGVRESKDSQRMDNLRQTASDMLYQVFQIRPSNLKPVGNRVDFVNN